MKYALLALGAVAVVAGACKPGVVKTTQAAVAQKESSAEAAFAASHTPASRELFQTIRSAPESTVPAEFAASLTPALREGLYAFRESYLNKLQTGEVDGREFTRAAAHNEFIAQAQKAFTQHQRLLFEESVNVAMRAHSAPSS